MLKSMTAYGRATAISSVGRIVFEIQSVNRKFLEVHLTMPKELRRFEIDIRKRIAAEISCGQVRVHITARFEALNPVVVAPNLAFAKDLHRAWQQVAEALNVDFKEQFNLALLAQEEGILVYDEDVEHDELYRKLIDEAAAGALKQFSEMRSYEGKVLLADLEERLLRLNASIEIIAEKVVDAPRKYREKLIRCLEEAVPGCVENEERLLREVVIYAERVDVTEEITRFKSHLDQFNKLLKTDTAGTGKAIDFIIQELGREINTLGSKSPDIDVSHLVVDVKTELAKIREQIQNIE